MVPDKHKGCITDRKTRINEEDTCNRLEVFLKSPARITLAMEEGEVASERGSVSLVDGL